MHLLVSFVFSLETLIITELAGYPLLIISYGIVKQNVDNNLS